MPADPNIYQGPGSSGAQHPLVNVVAGGPGNADNTGATDCSVILAASVAACAASGQASWYPSGTYLFSVPLSGSPNMPSNSTIVMGGKWLSTLVPTGVFPFTAGIIYSDTAAHLETGTLASTPPIGSSTLSVSLATKPVVGQAIALSHGASYGLYDVLAVSGVASPWTVTIDRPTVYPWTSAAGGDSVFIFASYPKHITIDGKNLGSGTGTGDQFFELARTFKAFVTGIDYGPSGGLITSAVIGFDTGSRESSLEHCSIDLTGSQIGPPALGSNGLYFQSNERSFMRFLRIKGAALVGATLLDSYGCGMEDVSVYDCSLGVSIASLGVGPDGKTSFGCYDCYISGGSAINCGTGAAIGYNGPSYNGAISDFAATYCTSVGISIAAGSTAARVARCDVTGSATGLAVTAGATDTQIVGLRADNCTINALALAADCDVTGLEANCNINGAAVVNTNTALTIRLRGINITQSNAGGYGIQTNGSGRLEIDGGTIAGACAVGLYISASTPVVVIKNLRITAANQGIFVAAGATLIIGEGCDFTGCTSQITGTGAVSRGTVLLNGTTGVAVAFPAANAQSTMALSLSAVGGAGTGLAPKWAVTPGTGFTVTGPVAGDTSTWHYNIQ